MSVGAFAAALLGEVDAVTASIGHVAASTLREELANEWTIHAFRLSIVAFAK